MSKVSVAESTLTHRISNDGVIGKDGATPKKPLPERTMSRKSSMGLDPKKGYDFSFSKKHLDLEKGDQDKSHFREELHKYLLSNGGKWSRLFHVFWLVAFLLTIGGIIIATLLVPTYFVETVQKESIPDNSTTCFGFPHDICDKGDVRVYLMNITNPGDVLNGYASPIIQQVGPYYFKQTKYAFNNYIIHPGRYQRPIQAVQHNYTDKVWEYSQSFSCATCNLNNIIIGPNALYLGMMKMTNWSEQQLIISMMPTTLSTMLSGMSEIFQGMGYNNTNVRAINQWASCMELGGMSFSTIHKVMPQLTNFTIPFQNSAPEFCAFAQSLSIGTGNNDVGLDSISATRILMDPLYGILNPLSGPVTIGTILMSDPISVSLMYNISAMNASFLQGYLSTIVMTTAKNAFQQLLGPPLQTTSSGILISRTVNEWIFGYNDPIVSTLQPGTKPIRMAIRKPALGSNETIIYDATEPMIFHSTVLATGSEASQRDDANSMLTYNGQRTFKAMVDLRHYPTYDLNLGRLRPRWVSITGVIRNFVIFLAYPILQRKTLQHHGYGNVKGVRTVKYRLVGDEVMYHCNPTVSACTQQHQHPHVYDISEVGSNSIVTYGYFARADPRYKMSLGHNTNNMFSSFPQPVDVLHVPEWEVCYAVGMIVKYRGIWQTSHMIRQTDLFHNRTWNQLPMYGGMWVPANVAYYNEEMNEKDAKDIKDALQKLKSMQQMTLLIFLLPAAILMSASIWYFCLSAEAVHKRENRMVVRKKRQQSVLYKEPARVWDGLSNVEKKEFNNEINFIQVDVKNKPDNATSKPKCCG